VLPDAPDDTHYLTLGASREKRSGLQIRCGESCMHTVYWPVLAYGYIGRVLPPCIYVNILIYHFEYVHILILRYFKEIYMKNFKASLFLNVL